MYLYTAKQRFTNRTSTDSYEIFFNGFFKVFHSLVAPGVNFVFSYSPNKKSKIETSGERGGRGIGLLFPTQELRKFSFNFNLQ